MFGIDDLDRAGPSARRAALLSTPTADTMDWPTGRLGIVAALPGEARMLARLRPRGRARLSDRAELLLSGMGAQRAEVAARTLADDGVDVLMSWGTAAALAPGIDPGALVLASAVRSADGLTRSTDAAWRTRLATALAPTHQVFEQTLAEAAELAGDASAKQALFRETGAIACDMESAAIAAVAAEHGLGFVVVRAIIDDASMTLPPVARAALDADGRLRAGAFASALFGRPAAMHVQLRALKNLAVAYRAARMSLASAGHVVRREVGA